MSRPVSKGYTGSKVFRVLYVYPNIKVEYISGKRLCIEFIVISVKNTIR